MNVWAWNRGCRGAMMGLGARVWLGSRGGSLHRCRSQHTTVRNGLDEGNQGMMHSTVEAPCTHLKVPPTVS
jgi:hypothetical protein